MQLLNIPVDIAGDANEDKEWEQRGTTWASATRELRRLRHRIEAAGRVKTSGRLGCGKWLRSSGISKVEQRATI
jgi:hypothetical protein